MANNGTLMQLKRTAADLIDNNGNFRTTPVGLVGSRNLSDERIRLLQSIFSLLRDTKIVCNETKLYIFNRYITMQGVADEMAKLRVGENYSPEDVKFNTTKTKINYDRDKIEKIFGVTLLPDIILVTNNGDKIKNYIVLVAEAMGKYGSKDLTKLKDGLALKLEADSLCGELSEEKYQEFLSTIKPYLRSHMKKIEDSIDKSAIGYFNYLLYGTNLAGIDKERLEELKQLLGQEE